MWCTNEDDFDDDDDDEEKRKQQQNDERTTTTTKKKRDYYESERGRLIIIIIISGCFERRLVRIWFQIEEEKATRREIYETRDGSGGLARHRGGKRRVGKNRR